MFGSKIRTWYWSFFCGREGCSFEEVRLRKVECD